MSQRVLFSEHYFHQHLLKTVHSYPRLGRERHIPIWMSPQLYGAKMPYQRFFRAGRLGMPFGIVHMLDTNLPVALVPYYCNEHNKDICHPVTTQLGCNDHQKWEVEIEVGAELTHLQASCIKRDLVFPRPLRVAHRT